MPAGQVPGKRRREGCAADPGRPQALALWSALVQATGDSCMLGRQPGACADESEANVSLEPALADKRT
eukprot:1344041-Alexandrium_andersonii.AAC.1